MVGEVGFVPVAGGGGGRAGRPPPAAGGGGVGPPRGGGGGGSGRAAPPATRSSRARYTVGSGLRVSVSAMSTTSAERTRGSRAAASIWAPLPRVRPVIEHVEARVAVSAKWR